MSDDSLKDLAIRKAYSELAAAIIKSGEDANDKTFLKSKWCEALRYMVQLRTGTGGKTALKKDKDIYLYTGKLR